MAAIGIDLGTTNSVGAYYDKEARILPGIRPDGLVPSVVVFRKPRKGQNGPGEILVGQAALDYAHRDPENAIFSIKRLMGRSYDEPKVADVKEKVSYAIVHASDSEDSGVRVLLDSKEYTPVEISALILKQIKETAERALGQPVTHAVITVPAYFEERQRAATRQAGKQAGLVIKKIIDEPSAAAIAYGFTVSQGKRQRLLVFDLGGGTFDVSIILTVMDPKGQNHFEVLEIRGDNWLGGDDFDNEIIGEIVAAIEREYKFNPSGDRVFQLLAKQAAEKAKTALSSATEADITLPAVLKTPEGEMVDLDLRVTRDRFNELIQPYVDRCMKHVRDALTGQGLTSDDIDTVLMVGGSTLVPLVFETVAGYFGREKVQQINPYHSVALGAGILAGTLAGIQCPNPKCGHVNDEASENCVKCGEPLAAAISVGSISWTDITAVSFGISAVRGNERDAFEVIIPKGTPYPLSSAKTKTFYTTRRNFICIPVYEGVDPVASNNEKQGEVLLSEEEFQQENVDVPANTPVEVMMNYTRDREVQLRIRVHGTAIEKEFKLRHDRPRQGAGAPTNARWREDLEQVLRVAEHFQSKYMGFMESRELARLDRDMQRAQEALKTANAVAGEESFNALIVTLDSCGVASLIFLAERVQEGASRERAAKLGEAISELKRKWYEGDKQGLAFLTTPLRAAIASEMSARKAQHEAAGQDEPSDGRLRVLLGNN